MIIKGFNKTTLLDFPGKVAATIFTGNCNFRCPFCQNSDLVLNPSSQPEITEEEIFSFLKKRTGIIEGICISGGEPTLQPDLLSFMEKLKQTGTAVKLDTNGYEPEILKAVLDNGLADMIAMDIKSDLNGYREITGLSDVDTEKIARSAEILMNSDTDYEFRTTVVKEYYNEKTAENIAEWLRGAEKYYLQKFEDNEKVIKPGLTSPDITALLKYRDILSKTIRQVEIRGTDY